VIFLQQSCWNCYDRLKNPDEIRAVESAIMTENQENASSSIDENGQLSDTTNSDVAARLAAVQSQMAAAMAQRPSASTANSVTLVAVSKRQSEAKIDAALTAGQRVFGENRVQEATSRWAARRAQYVDLTLHLIGPLQTNKVAEAVALFDVIEVVDREKLASALATEMTRQNRNLPCFIQVNTGEEPQKSGILPDQLDNFFIFCRDDLGLSIQGLMCIPPVDEDAAMHFALLSSMAKRLNLSNLSMGMSNDYTDAIGFGATSVRVGSAIFGARAN
jgi:pyridoxal phosphate enzyme (YggS family)